MTPQAAPLGAEEGVPFHESLTYKSRFGRAGRWAGSGCLDQLAVGGILSELVEGGVVVVERRLSVGPPGVALIDAGSRQGRFAGGTETELTDHEDAGRGLDADFGPSPLCRICAAVALPPVQAGVGPAPTHPPDAGPPHTTSRPAAALVVNAASEVREPPIRRRRSQRRRLGRGVGSVVRSCAYRRSG